MGFAEMLMEMKRAADDDKDDRPRTPRPPDDILALTLKEVAERYTAPNPFKVGDLVTVRRNYNRRGAGEPHCVVEVQSDDRRFPTNAEPGTQTFGERHNTRVACIGGSRNAVVCFWMDHYELEPWTGTVANIS